MIGPLKTTRTSIFFKNVLRYFCKVWHKSNLYILWFGWLRTPLPPGLPKKHLLVQSRVKRTDFSDQNIFFFGLNIFQTSSIWINVFLGYIRCCISWAFWTRNLIALVLSSPTWLNRHKVVYITFLRPLFQVGLRNGCLMVKVPTGAVFL